jgi:hypothetical protein
MKQYNNNNSIIIKIKRKSRNLIKYHKIAHNLNA